jgi:TetR/AcrR family transcriptional regulator, transcriptional repressor for nem operon
MKVSKVTAASHRAALLTAACRLLREKGFAGVGIAEIAAGAGLTHGAFYTHFASKEALCAEAVAAMASRSERGLRNARDLNAYLAVYFSPQHVAAVGEGCPFAALIGDAARDAGAVRSAFACGLEGVIDTLAAHDATEGGSRRARRASAIALLAGMIGGLMMARAVNTSAGEEILSAMKASVSGRKSRRRTIPARRKRRAP